MPLPLERLDVRTFDDLVEEARALIPRAAPSWTDHNYHDPGITLIELLSWLVEQDFYRLDRTPEANVRAFLRAIGIEQQLASVADSVVVVSNTGPDIVLPSGLQLGDPTGAIVFQTVDALFVSPASLGVVLCGAIGALEDRTADNAAGIPFAPFGAAPQPDAALLLSLDAQPAATPQSWSFYVWVGDAESDRETVARVRDEYAAANTDQRRDHIGSGGVCPDRDWRLHHSVRTVWEYSATGDIWLPLSGVVDETRAFTTSGFVRCVVPADIAARSAASTPASLADTFAIRCRLTTGTYDCAPRISRIAINAVRARHERSVDDTRPYVSTGRAAQLIDLASTPVVPGSTSMRVTIGGAVDSTWTEVAQWDRVGPRDRSYRLDAQSGRIEFGDGRWGQVPPAGATIDASYRTGGGTAGNVPARTLDTLLRGPHNEALVANWLTVRAALGVRQPVAASGGRPAETLAAASARAVAVLTRVDRTVTIQDFETLARGTPGVDVARAFGVPNFHPQYPGISAAGCVAVVIIPRCPDDRPTPSDALLDEVQRYLRRRRPLTTEIHVVAPCYKRITVYARVHAAAAADRSTVAALAASALETFLNPLRGGPDGTGWSVGRAVYRTEILTLLSGLPGVAYVDALELQVNDEDAARCGNAEICARGLVASGTHHITIA